QARAFDGYEAGPWSELQHFTANPALDHTLPPASEITAPIEDEEVSAWPLVIEWSPVVDADGDVLVYDVQLAADEAFTAPIVDEEGIVYDDGGMVLEVADLAGGAAYFARVRARDAFHAGPWTEVTFALVNRAPPVPELIAPV